MKILHVVRAFYPETYWEGPAVSAYNLCTAPAKQPAIKLEVVTPDTAGTSLSDRVPAAAEKWVADVLRTQYSGWAGSTLQSEPLRFEPLESFN